MSTDLQGSAAELLAQFGEQHVVAFFLVLTRLAPLFALAPLFSSKMVPMRARGVIAVALAIGISPVVSRGQTISLDVMTLGELVAKEILVGFAFAFALGALFAAVSVAGGFLDTMIGFSYGGLIDPVNGVQSTIISTAYGLIGILVFIAIGGDAWVIAGLAHTYDVIGLTEFPSLARMVNGAGTAFVGILGSAIEIAGPVMLALILTDAAFGVISRVVPQLNVFQVGFPAKVVIGLLLIGATLPFVANWLGGELQTDVNTALQTLRVG